MNTLRLRATPAILAATTFAAAMAASIGAPGLAHASIDEPWPEPPSCSNETLTCDPIEDWIAYECFFENPDSPFEFCDNPLLEEMRSGTGKTLAAEVLGHDSGPTPTKVVAPIARR